MNNNDILRRLRYTFDLNDDAMIGLFALAEAKRSRAEISNWLKKEDEPDFHLMQDRELAIFLNGLINDKRGKREGPQPALEQRLNNNIIFRKLKIALNLRDNDIMDIFHGIGKRIGPHELSSFFRKPGHAKYRPCQDQYLRNFLSGLQEKYRPAS